MKTKSILNGCERCPRCFLVPTLGWDADFNSYELSCPDHGNVAMGFDVPMAVKHWNQLINFKRQKS